MPRSKKSKKSRSGKMSEKPDSRATNDQMTSASSSANQQVNSKFMQLPQEIRDEIYATVFFSTRFAFGERAFDRIERRRIVSSNRGTALALLRTCRRVWDEIGVSWLHQVLFHFEDPESLLGKLAGIPSTLRKQIRHVRVSGHTLMISYDDDDVYYRTVQILKLLPGLELDTLTILGDRISQVSYETLDHLIRYSDGWKELRYLSHTSELLGYDDDMLSFGPFDAVRSPYLRQPQPSDWQSILEQRDGQASHPSVVIYQATDVAVSGAILHSSTRKVLTQAFTTDQDARTYGTVEDATLMRPGEIGKEVLIVAKRGAGVDYAEKEGSPHLAIGDIREEFPGKTWKDIKAQQEAMFKDDEFDDESDDGCDSEASYCSADEFCFLKQRLENSDIVDKYRHVDEYTWPPLYF